MATTQTIDDAFQFLKQRTGWPVDEAIYQLKQALLAGRARATCHRFVDGKLQSSGEVRPDFWDQLKLEPVDGHVKVRALWNLEPGSEWEYVLPTKDVEALAISSAKSTKPAPRRRGPATTHDWHTICGEIASRCIDLKNRRIVKPKTLEQDMLRWCADEFDLEPAPSEMREAIARMRARLGT
jgi:hypothetical protein